MGLTPLVIKCHPGQTHISLTDLTNAYADHVIKLDSEDAAFPLKNSARGRFIQSVLEPLIKNKELIPYGGNHLPIDVRDLSSINTKVEMCGAYFFISQLRPFLEGINIHFEVAKSSASGHADKPWLVHYEGDPQASYVWHTAARYFARELLKEKPNLKRNNPQSFYSAIADELFKVGIHPRNNKTKKYDGDTVQKSLNGTGIQ